jgi:hypothetical protein
MTKDAQQHPTFHNAAVCLWWGCGHVADVCDCQQCGSSAFMFWQLHSVNRLAKQVEAKQDLS